MKYTKKEQSIIFIILHLEGLAPPNHPSTKWLPRHCGFLSYKATGCLNSWFYLKIMILVSLEGGQIHDMTMLVFARLGSMLMRFGMITQGYVELISSCILW